MRLRQVVSVAADLPTAEKNLCEVFSLPPGYNDPGVSEFGGHNTVLRIGHTFLEVISPNTEGAAARRYLKRRGDASRVMAVGWTGLAALCVDIGSARNHGRGDPGRRPIADCGALG